MSRYFSNTDQGFGFALDMNGNDFPIQEFDDEQPPETPTTPAAASAPTDDQKDVAGSIRDAYAVQQLLNAAEREGTAVLAEVTQSALARHLADGTLRTSVSLFNPLETKRLAAAMAKTLATSNLLGRFRVHKTADRIKAIGEEGIWRMADDPDEPEFTTFADEPLRPLVPELAVDYFRSLEPAIGVEPVRFGMQMRRDAFTLARQTDVTLLDRIKAIIGDSLETGVGMGGGARDLIRGTMEAAGVSPRNPQYAEMVLRTNAMDSYNTGADEARMDPEIADLFPVWQYMGILDGRQRKEHEVHFGKYFLNSIPFAMVRDSIRVSPWNCRCATRPISRFTWKKLQAAGAQVENFSAGMPTVSTFAERTQFPTDPACFCCS